VTPTIRRATLEDQAAVEALSQTDSAVKEFKYLWRRYQNWVAEHMPIIAVVEGLGVVGFHAATFGREYVNSYYQMTAPAVRGQGVGGAMVALVLNEAARVACRRLKFKVPHDSAGQRFWEGFGLRHFGTDAKHRLYDVSLAGIVTPGDLSRATVGHIPEAAARRYQLAGVQFVEPARTLFDEAAE
jgi:GNAT superfamily N-acetyltransferase